MSRDAAHVAGRRRRSVRGGLVLAPVDGAYAPIPVCDPRDWVAAVAIALTLPSVEARRRAMKISAPGTILKVAAEYAAAADHGTGRNVAVSHATVATAIGYSEATVKKIVRFLSRLGFVVEVARGRNRLTLEQLAAARQNGAHSQRAVASTRALTIPRSVDGAPLPFPATVNDSSHVSEMEPTRAARAQKAAASRRPATRRRNEASRPRRPRTLATQRLAAGLSARIPWLERTGAHIGHLCDLVDRLGLARNGWTVQQILDRIEQHARAAGLQIADPAQQRDPLRYLAWMLHHAISPGEQAPLQQLHTERELRLARQARERELEAARRQQIEAEADEIQAIINAMRLPQRPQASTSRLRGAY